MQHVVGARPGGGWGDPMRQNLLGGAFSRGVVRSDVVHVPLDSVTLGSPQSAWKSQCSWPRCSPG